jgi:DNA-directed RNA polymerase specialized sigma24 family protein
MVIDPGEGGSTFGPRSPVVVMGPHPSAPAVAKDLLPDLLRGGRGRALRAQLASRHPERPAEDIEEAVQAAATDFLAEGQGITDPGAAYAWVRTAAHRILGHEAERRRREVAVDPLGHGLEEPAPPDDDPARELLAGED